MKRALCVTVILLFICTSIQASTQLLSANEIHINNGDTIYVDVENKNGPWEGSIDHPYQTIQDAISHANDEDTIFIYSGKYYENLIINKTITLTGQDKKSTIIDGQYQSWICWVQSSGAVIENLFFQNTSGFMNDAAILAESSHIRINNCMFSRTKTAISIHNQSNTSIDNCLFYTNGEGIYINQSGSIFITHCVFNNNGLGIHIADSKLITIQSSHAHTNGIGFYITGSENIVLQKCGAYNNNDNQGGVFIESSHDVMLTDCIISHNGFGVKSSNSNDIHVNYSTISYNTHAGFLIMDQSTDISIQHCTITKNLRISIYNSKSTITFENNNIYNSVCGLYTETGVCNGEQNWWGSVLGPGLIEGNQRDNIKQIRSSVDVNPWKNEYIDSSGASWIISDLFEKEQMNESYHRKISFQEVDTDKDGCPDWWEEKYDYDPISYDNHNQLDPDEDGLSNIEECFTDNYGSNPFIKDIFWEFDWMECITSDSESNKPSDTYIQKAIDIFAEYDIALHVDVGNLGGGEQIPSHHYFSFADLRDYYWNYFLHNDLNNPRKGIFHYALICDYGPASGFAFMGWDSLDGFCISADILKDNHEVPYPRQRFIMGASIHELGHTLGLTVDDHGGNDNKIATLPFTIQWFKYLSYPSCMNYFYTYLILGFSDGSHGPGDFNDWDHMDFSFFKNTHFILPERYR